MEDSNFRTIALTGLFALLGTVLGGVIKARSDNELARYKFNSDMITKALGQPEDSVRLRTLQLFLDLHLINNEEIRGGVENVLKKRAKTLKRLPQLLTASTLASVAPVTIAPPLKPSARIYLLTGNPKKEASLELLRTPLQKAGFPIINAKYLIDPGRPPFAEIRYFFSEDQLQAERLAEFFRIQLNQKGLLAKQYPNAEHRVSGPGYIEVWTGK